MNANHLTVFLCLDLYMYINQCLCVCVSVYVRLCVFVSVCMCLFVCACVYVCLCVFESVCICRCVCASLCLWVCVSLCVSLCLCQSVSVSVLCETPTLPSPMTKADVLIFQMGWGVGCNAQIKFAIKNAIVTLPNTLFSCEDMIMILEWALQFHAAFKEIGITNLPCTMQK